MLFHFKFKILNGFTNVQFFGRNFRMDKIVLFNFFCHSTTKKIIIEQKNDFHAQETKKKLTEFYLLKLCRAASVEGIFSFVVVENSKNNLYS